MEDVRLDFSEDSLRGIAHKAIARKTGARGLRSIMEAILLEPMFELPSLDGVEAMIINKAVVEGRAKPLYMYTDRRDEATAATRPAS
jgi:ATP-dependent Clp protease ATP-binding subunit ClpX